MKQNQYVVEILCEDGQIKYLSYKSHPPKLVLRKRDASQFRYRTEAFVVGHRYKDKVNNNAKWNVSTIHPRGLD